MCVCVDARYTGGLLSKQTASVGRIDSTTRTRSVLIIMNERIDSQRVKKAQKKPSEEEVGVGGRKRRRIGGAEKRRIEKKKVEKTKERKDEKIRSEEEGDEEKQKTEMNSE